MMDWSIDMVKMVMSGWGGKEAGAIPRRVGVIMNPKPESCYEHDDRVYEQERL